MKAITDTLNISRSNQYEKKKGRKRYGTRKDDEIYLPLVKKITDNRPTFGYRRVTAVINRILVEKEHDRINHKRVYRIMRANHLLLQKYTGRPVRAHTSDIITLASNMRWCSDIFEILCWNAQRIRIAFAMDCCDREIMAYMATTGGITGYMVRDLIASSMEYRFGKADSLPHPIEWLSDNGSAYTAIETISFARLMGFKPCTTPYYSPESNGMAESFVKTFKRDYVYMHDLPDAISVMEQLPLWFEDYNEYHPHKGLKMLSPREYRRKEAKLETCPV